jgi:outer membrane biogenesis lipoprotein LolB
MRHRIWLIGLIASALLTGCGSSGPKRDINDPTNSLVFGYIDMDDAPTGVD